MIDPKEPATSGEVAEIREMLSRVLQRLEEPAPTVRSSYSVEEVAGLLDRSVFQVRTWCRQGRVHASKRSQKRGGAELWSVEAAEVERYRNEGLLPIDLHRNEGYRATVTVRPDGRGS